MLRKVWPLWVDWALLGAWMGVIFYWSNQVHPDIPGIDIGLIRKSGHASEYIILFVLWLRALQHTLGWPAGMTWRMALVALVVYAASDELHQHIVGRDGNIVDVLIDVALPAAAVVWQWRAERAQQTFEVTEKRRTSEV